MSEQQCIQCTWDGVRLVKLCKHHQEIDELHKRLAAAEAALNLSTDERQTAEVRCEELTERLAAAEAFVAKHRCQTCGGVRVREAELCKCDEAAKGERDES